MLLLRAMKQAAYDVVNVGHFGLASRAYLHFTSPIRRYPDLVVHRAVRALLQGERIDASEAAVERLRTAATVASDMERRGMEVEREVVDLYRALYMRAHVGDIVEGTVTAVVGAGVFVAIDDPFVDVLVRMEGLGPDVYEVDEEGLRIIGTRSGDRISIGDRMIVVVDDVSILRRTIYARRIIDENERRFKKGNAKGKVKERAIKEARAGRGDRGGKTRTEPAPPRRRGKADKLKSNRRAAKPKKARKPRR
jgi:ribonuclease R